MRIQGRPHGLFPRDYRLLVMRHTNYERSDTLMRNLILMLRSAIPRLMLRRFHVQLPMLQRILCLLIRLQVDLVGLHERVNLPLVQLPRRVLRRLFLATLLLLHYHDVHSVL